jgi:general secretion pathway protein D
MKNLHRSQLAWAALALALAAGSLIAQDGDSAARKPQLLAEALKARDEGNLQAAKASFEAILAIDAKDIGATEGLASVNSAITDAEAAKKAADAPKPDAPVVPADEAASNEKLFAQVSKVIEEARNKSAAGNHEAALELLDGANTSIAALTTHAAQARRDSISLAKQEVGVARDAGGPSAAKDEVKRLSRNQSQFVESVKLDVDDALLLIRKGGKDVTEDRKNLKKAIDLLDASEKKLGSESLTNEKLFANIREAKSSAVVRQFLLAIGGAEPDRIQALRLIDEYKILQDASLARAFSEKKKAVKAVFENLEAQNKEKEKAVQANHENLEAQNKSKWTPAELEAHKKELIKSKLPLSVELEAHKAQLRHELELIEAEMSRAVRALEDDSVVARLRRELESKKDSPVGRGVDEISPGLRIKDDKVNELLVRGRARYLYGDYQGALDSYREVLQYQPNNSESKAYQIRIRQMLSENSGQWNRGVTKGKLLELLDETWKLPEVFNRENIKIDSDNGNDPVIEKMKSIQLPEGFLVRDQPLDRALIQLQTLAATYDKDQKGVNIVLIDTANKNPTVSLQLRGVSVYQALDYTCKRVGFSFTVGSGGIVEVREDTGDSLLETEIYPLSTAAVLKMTGLGAGGNAGAAAGGGAASPFGGAAAGGAGAGDGQRPEEVAIKNFLTRSGVAFELPSTLSYDGTNLIVYQSRKNLDRVKNIIRRYSDIKQVHIEAKFMEVEQKILNELGVNWNLSPTLQTIAGVTTQVDPTATATARTNLRSINSVFATNNSTVRSLNVTGIPSIPQPAPNFPGGINLGNTNQSYSANVGIIGAETLSLAIRAIEENAGSDLMSSPSLTVLDGKTAVIKVAQLLRYPQAYGDTQSNVGTGGGGGTALNPNAGAAVAITAGTPQDFTIQEVGVTLEVTPTVAADDSIALNLKPKVTEFEGFVEYGGTSVAISGNITVSVPSGFFQPIFSTREVTTEVTVFDGATVVIGGLTREEVKTIDDKVPVLGSIPLIGAAFRSSGKSIQKKSLMVFVTANLVSPGGATLRSSHPGMRAGSTFSNPTLISPGGAVYREPIEVAPPSGPAPVVAEPAK